MKARAECSIVVTLDTYSPPVGATVNFGGFTAKAGAVDWQTIELNDLGEGTVFAAEDYIPILYIQNLSELEDLSVTFYDCTNAVRVVGVTPGGIAVITGVLYSDVLGGAAMLNGVAYEFVRAFYVGSDTLEVNTTTATGEETD